MPSRLWAVTILVALIAHGTGPFGLPASFADESGPIPHWDGSAPKPSFGTQTVFISMRCLFPLVEDLPGWKAGDPEKIAALIQAFGVRSGEPGLLTREQQAQRQLQRCILRQWPTGPVTRLEASFPRKALYLEALRAVASWQPLAARKPNDADYAHSLACAHFLAGRALLRAPYDQPQVKKGLKQYERAADIWLRLAIQADNRAAEDQHRYRSCAPEAWWLVTSWHARNNDFPAALASWERVGRLLAPSLPEETATEVSPRRTLYFHRLAYLQHLAGDHRADASRRQQLSGLYRQWMSDKDNRSTAIRFLRTTNEMITRLPPEARQGLADQSARIAAELSAERDIQTLWADQWVLRGRCAHSEGRIPEAIDCFEQAITVQYGLLTDDDLETRQFPYEFEIPRKGLCRINLMRDLHRIAELQRAANRPGEARTTHQRIESLWREIVQHEPRLEEITEDRLRALDEMTPRTRHHAIRMSIDLAGFAPPSVQACRNAMATLLVAEARWQLSGPSPNLEIARSLAERACYLAQYDSVEPVELLAEIYARQRRSDTALWEEFLHELRAAHHEF